MTTRKEENYETFTGVDYYYRTVDGKCAGFGHEKYAGFWLTVYYTPAQG